MLKPRVPICQLAGGVYSAGPSVNNTAACCCAAGPSPKFLDTDEKLRDFLNYFADQPVDIIKIAAQEQLGITLQF